MIELTSQNKYHSPDQRPSWFARKFPDWYFYPRMIGVVFKAAHLSKRGRYGSDEWIDSSRTTMKALEGAGVHFSINNLDIIRNLKSSCVFIGNHMSTLETFILPCLIQPYRNVTFIIKKELIEYPVFKHVMIHRDPVVVGRANPRDDLKAVIDGGSERLQRDLSIIVFPQTTRRVDFDPKNFNTIGIKLAKKAGVPIVPFALRTDAWGNGKKIKEFGPVNPTLPVYIEFGEPVSVSGNGREEHEAIIDFIQNRVDKWM